MRVMGLGLPMLFLHQGHPVKKEGSRTPQNHAKLQGNLKDSCHIMVREMVAELKNPFETDCLGFQV